MGCRGFSLPELLIATMLALVLAAGVLSFVSMGRAVAGAGAETIDLEQRLRAASEAVSADLAIAGAGPVTGVLGRPIGAVVPCVLPFVVGAGGDPPGTVRSSAVTVFTSAPHGAAVALAAAFVPSAGVANLAVSPAVRREIPRAGSARATSSCSWMEAGRPICSTSGPSPDRPFSSSPGGSSPAGDFRRGPGWFP